MPYISPEVIEQARQIDLLTYLRRFEPDNVEEVKGTRNVYRTVDQDRKSTRLNSSHPPESRMPSSA